MYQGRALDNPPSEPHVFRALTDLEVHLPVDIDRLLMSQGQDLSITACPHGVWMSRIISHRSFPKDPLVLKHVRRNLLSEIEKNVATLKDQVCAIDTFSQDPSVDRQLAELALSTRCQVSQDLMMRLGAFLSKEDREIGVCAAAQNNEASVVLALLESGESSDDLKQQALLWSIEHGYQELFSKITKHVPLSQQARIAAMQAAVKANQHEMLQTILSLGQIPERAKHQALQEAISLGFEKIYELLQSSRSFLLR
jgi:hypothetical protein